MEVIELTKKLINYNTINGNETEIVKYVGNILSANGFDVDFHEYKDGRLNLIASKGLSDNIAPVVLSGHFDVVPLGAAEWKHNPFDAEIIDGKLFGRGSTDMKGGLAAIIIAAIEVFEDGNPPGGVKLILTANEELGCKGASSLAASDYNIGKARGLIIAEPTSNIPYISHKGGLYITAKTYGVTAHSSMPDKGVNAIYKAARGIVKISQFKFDVEEDLLLGFPTINVGKITGGLNLNSVPDKAEFTIDVRSTTKLNNNEAFARLKKLLGDEIELEKIIALNAMASEETDKFIQTVYSVCDKHNIKRTDKKSISYLTDASVLKPWLNNVPTVILGPGEPELAHQTDEFCFVNKINEAVKIYKEITAVQNIYLHNANTLNWRDSVYN